MLALDASRRGDHRAVEQELYDACLAAAAAKVPAHIVSEIDELHTEAAALAPPPVTVRPLAPARRPAVGGAS